MKRLATNLILVTALLSTCIRTASLRAAENQRHHESGIIGQAVVTLNATVMLNDGPVLDDPLWPIQCTVTVYRVTEQDSKPIFLGGFDLELVTQVQTDAEGYFEVTLKPGTYYLLPEPPPRPQVPSSLARYRLFLRG